MPTTDTDTRQLGGQEIKRVVYTAAAIEERVSAMAREISAAYGPED